MSDFFVEQLFGGNVILAIPLALIAGLISFLSPCVLPLVPGYVTYAAGFSRSRGRVLLGSILFVVGFSALFISYGAALGGIGSTIAANSEIVVRVLGIVTIAMGFIFYGAFPMMPTLRPNISTTGGLVGAPLLGFLFGVGWTPCIGPALATVMTLSFSEGTALRGAVLSFAYCIGLGAPFILSGLYLDRSARLRRFLVHRGDLVSKIGGVFMIFIGLLQILGLWSDVTSLLRSLIADFVPVI